MANYCPTPNPKIVYTASKGLFASRRSNGQYLFEPEWQLSAVITEGQNVVCPLVVDTEFWQPTWSDRLKNQESVEVVYKGQKKEIKLGKDYWSHGRYGITTQIKGIHEKEGMILAHQDLKLVAASLREQTRHPIASSGFHPVDYLQKSGIPITLKHTGTVVKEYKKQPLPTFEFVLYAFFALAEWKMIADSEFKNDLIAAMERSKGHHVEMKKRLRTVYSNKHRSFDSIDMPWIVSINGTHYRVKICVIDPCGIHGVANYKDLCEACNVPVPHKDLMDEYKEQMHIGYFEKPEDFDNYSLGDLEVYKALANNAELFKEVWKSLDIEEYYQVPSLTIGATVARLFEAKIFKLFNIDSKEDTKTQQEILDKLCSKASAEFIKHFINHTLALCAKTNGGRCRNNRPNLAKIVSAMVDMDYASCYGEGQRNQLYPFGNPIHEKYSYPSKINSYKTLREWLKERKWGKKDCHLIPGLWKARVCTKEIWKNGEVTYALLETPQDILESWFNFKIEHIKDMKTDSDKDGASDNDFLQVKSGETKIFNHQVINALIQHDFIQWVENIASPQQKNELLDNLYVHAAIYYPAYDRVNSPQELLERINNHTGKNTVKSGKRKKGSYINERSEECTAWYAVNLGEFIIDDLLAWRKICPKKNSDGSKNAMNTLYKLCINTLYGVMVSPFFKISNVVVGNNITARARIACWYAEKGLYGILSITDGTPFDMNNVVYALKNRRVTAQSVVNLHREDNPGKRQLRLAPLGGYKNIKLEWMNVIEEGKEKQLPILHLISENDTTILKPEYLENKRKWTNPAHDWVDETAFTHLQNVFPKVDILHKPTKKLKVYKGEDSKPIKEFYIKNGQFQFEAKSFYDRGYFHGSANYYLKGEGGDALAMRSHEKKQHQTPHTETLEDEEISIIYTTEYHEQHTPAHIFLSSLEHPKNVERGKVFIKNGILKVNEARKNKKRWNAVGRVAGDTIQKSGLLREFSQSQFTFLHLEQYKSISREINFNKRKYCQTYEGFFINNDGTLDFEAMIREIDIAISEGCLSLNQKFDSSRNRHRSSYIKHPASEILEKTREILLRPELAELEEDYFNDVANLIIASDESGILYTVDGDYDPTEAMVIKDDSLLDDIDFGW